MLQRAFSQSQQRPQRVEAQFFKFGYKKQLSNLHAIGTPCSD
jgi:hypothetical protein